MYKILVGKESIELNKKGLIFVDVRKGEQDAIVESIMRSEETSKDETSAVFSLAHPSQSSPPSLNVLENLLLATGPTPSEQEIERGHQILEKIGLSDHTNDPVSFLTIEEKRRLCLARAILSDTPILIVNLPFESKELPNVLPLLKEAAKDRLVLLVMEGLESLRDSADGFLLVRDGKTEKAFLPKEEGIESSGKTKRSPKHSFFSLFRLGFKILPSKALICLSLLLLAVMTGAFGTLIHGSTYDEDQALSAFILDRGTPSVLQTNYDFDEDQGSKLKAVVSDGFVPVSPHSVTYNIEEIGTLYRTLNLALYEESQMAFDEIVYGRKPESSTDLLLPLSLAEEIVEVGYHDPFTFQTTATSIEELIGQPLFPNDNGKRAFSKTTFEPYVVCGIVDVKDPTLSIVAYVNQDGLDRVRERSLSLYTMGYIDEMRQGENDNHRINLDVFDGDNTFSLFFDSNKTQLLQDEVLVNLPYLATVNGDRSIDFSIPAEFSLTGKEESYRQDVDSFFSQTLYRNALGFVAENNVDEAFHSDRLPIEKMTEKYYADQGKEIPSVIDREDQVQIIGLALHAALDHSMNWIPYCLDVIRVYQQTAKENIARCFSERTIRIQKEKDSSTRTIEKKVVGCYIDEFWGEALLGTSFGLCMNEDEILSIEEMPKEYTAALIRTPTDRKTLTALLRTMKELGFEFENKEIRDMTIDIQSSKRLFRGWMGEIVPWVLLSLAFAALILVSFVLLKKKYQTSCYETETLLSLGWSKKEHDVVLFAPFVALLLFFLVLSLLSVVVGIVIFDACHPFWIPFGFLFFLLPVAVTALLGGIFLGLKKTEEQIR